MYFIKLRSSKVSYFFILKANKKNLTKLYYNNEFPQIPKYLKSSQKDFWRGTDAEDFQN